MPLQEPNKNMLNTQDRFQERIVCYIDLLGFGSAISKVSRNKDELTRILNLLKECQDKIKLQQSRNLEFQFLSDSIFFATKNIDAHSITSAVSCCQDISMFFAMNGFMVRGGMASGLCHISSSIILGEPVVKAVKIEEKISEFPRIVVARSTMDIIRKSIISDAITPNILRGVDGPFWIDPFKPLFDFAEKFDKDWKGKSISISEKEVAYKNRNDCISKINQITKFVETNIQEFQEDRKVFANYRWMYDYLTVNTSRLSAIVGNEIEMPKFI
jgi:hypothetical protein